MVFARLVNLEILGSLRKLTGREDLVGWGKLGRLRVVRHSPRARPVAKRELVYTAETYRGKQKAGGFRMRLRWPTPPVP